MGHDYDYDYDYDYYYYYSQAQGSSCGWKKRTVSRTNLSLADSAKLRLIMTKGAFFKHSFLRAI